MPINAPFWAAEELILYEYMFPIIRKIVRRGADDGIKVISRLIDTPVTRLGVDFELVNFNADKWAQDNTFKVVKQISSTNMDAFLKEFPVWQQSGKPLRFLVEALESSYGLWRAEMVAVTETTRSYTNGNIIGWRDTGFVGGKKWNSVHDGSVSEICKSLDGKTVPLEGYFVDHEGNLHFAPPGHVGCRSYVSPVLN
jgi:hypothetical protein